MRGAVIAGAVFLIACGGLPPAAHRGPLPQLGEIAIQPADLGLDWMVCTDPYSPGPTGSFTYRWSDLEALGAVAGIGQVLAPDAATCDSIERQRGATEYAANFVIRFPSEPRARAAYEAGSLTGGFLAPPQIKGQPGVTQGWATGLGPNSTTLAQPRLFFAAFESRGLVVALWIRGVPPATALGATQKIADRIG